MEQNLLTTEDPLDQTPGPFYLFEESGRLYVGVVGVGPNFRIPVSPLLQKPISGSGAHSVGSNNELFYSWVSRTGGQTEVRLGTLGNPYTILVAAGQQVVQNDDNTVVYQANAGGSTAFFATECYALR